MQDMPSRKPPEAHGDRNRPPVDRLPEKGDRRDDARRHRPGKDSRDES